MAALKRMWGYVKTATTRRVEQRMDPAVQLEQALSEARRADQDLRNQAARVIAHRTEVQMKLDRAVDDAARAKEQTVQALRNADAAQTAGDAGEVERWNRTAQALALRLESAETLVETLKDQYRAAQQQSDVAKQHVDDNALELERLAAKRLELLGKLEQAKLQEQVNRTLQTLHRPVDAGAPSLSEIEEKIERRMALASATAELEAGSVEGAQRDVERSIAQTAAQARIASLRAELGLAAPPAAGALPRGAAIEPDDEPDADA
jgi:phage shock protein A